MRPSRTLAARRERKASLIGDSVKLFFDQAIDQEGVYAVSPRRQPAAGCRQKATDATRHAAASALMSTRELR